MGEGALRTHSPSSSGAGRRFVGLDDLGGRCAYGAGAIVIFAQRRRGRPRAMPPGTRRLYANATGRGRSTPISEVADGCRRWRRNSEMA